MISDYYVSGSNSSERFYPKWLTFRLAFIIISKPEDIADEYNKLSQDDLRAAIALENSGLYNQAGYYYFQSMEKRIKYHIAKRTNIINDYFAESIKKQ